MFFRSKSFFTVLMVFAGIGFLVSLLRNPSAFIIPLTILGVILYFYKNPPRGGFRLPSWFKGNHSSRGSYGYRSSAPSSKKKRSPFRVIKGNRQDPRGDDDNKPTYH